MQGQNISWMFFLQLKLILRFKDFVVSLSCILHIFHKNCFRKRVQLFEGLFFSITLKLYTNIFSFLTNFVALLVICPVDLDWALNNGVTNLLSQSWHFESARRKMDLKSAFLKEIIGIYSSLPQMENIWRTNGSQYIKFYYK